MLQTSGSFGARSFLCTAGGGGEVKGEDGGWVQGPQSAGKWRGEVCLAEHSLVRNHQAISKDAYAGG